MAIAARFVLTLALVGGTVAQCVLPTGCIMSGGDVLKSCSGFKGTTLCAPRRRRGHARPRVFAPRIASRRLARVCTQGPAHVRCHRDRAGRVCGSERCHKPVWGAQ